MSGSYRMPATIVCQSSPLEFGDARMERFFSAVQDALPDIPLSHAITTGHTWRPIQDAAGMENEEQFQKTSRDRRAIIFGNGVHDETRMLHVTTGRASVGDRMAMRKTWTFRVALGEQILGTSDALADVLPAALARICSAVDAFVGQAAMPEFLAQWRNPAFVTDRMATTGTSKSVLPISRRPMSARTSDGFAFETALWWANYWSDPTARALSFPDADEDAPLKHAMTRVADKGWLVKLTDDPTDFSNPDHAERMDWAYRRFGA